MVFFCLHLFEKDAKCYLNATLYSSPSFSQEVDTVLPYGTNERVVSNSTCCDPPPFYWRGTIAEFRIYTRALSHSEIKAINEATK